MEVVVLTFFFFLFSTSPMCSFYTNTSQKQTMPDFYDAASTCWPYYWKSLFVRIFAQNEKVVAPLTKMRTEFYDLLRTHLREEHFNDFFSVKWKIWSLENQYDEIRRLATQASFMKMRSSVIRLIMNLFYRHSDL